MIEALRFIQQKDPAPVSKFEIIFCYPGFQAVLLYRLSHWLYQYKIPALPLLLSYLARFITGVEIHPGASIGKNFFIDHGMGVVIGETSVIKDNVHIYHGVTLGATRSIKGEKRHPTIENNVMIGAHSLILGNITVSTNSQIAAGAIVVDNIPPNSVVMGVKSKVTAHKKAPLVEYYI